MIKIFIELFIKKHILITFLELKIFKFPAENF